MSAVTEETKRILQQQFGYRYVDAHWMAANNWTDHNSRKTEDLKLARAQALANLEIHTAPRGD